MVKQKKPNILKKSLIGLGIGVRKGWESYKYHQTPEYKKSLVEKAKLENEALEQEMIRQKKLSEIRKFRGENRKDPFDGLF